MCTRWTFVNEIFFFLNLTHCAAASRFKKEKESLQKKKIFLVWICVAIFKIKKKSTINNLNNKNLKCFSDCRSFKKIKTEEYKKKFCGVTEENRRLAQVESRIIIVCAFLKECYHLSACLFYASSAIISLLLLITVTRRRCSTSTTKCNISKVNLYSENHYH